MMHELLIGIVAIDDPTPQAPPGSPGLLHILNWMAWLVMIAGVGAILYAGGKFGWERWHGGAVESPKIVLGALVGGILATSAGGIMTEITNAAHS